MAPTLAHVTEALDVLYPPALAEVWDAIGLVVGDPAAPVRRVLLAVDPVRPVVDEALSGGFDLLVTHHPLYLRGTTTVSAGTAKGRLVHDLVRGGCALFVAHTNADKAVGGVNDALAGLLGLQDAVPLTRDREPLDVLVVHVPSADADRVRDALVAAGAGRLGDYDSCSWDVTGTGRFRPLDGAHPTVGTIGEPSTVEEARLELVVPRAAQRAVLAALAAQHPYETPSFHLLPAEVPSVTGLGRVGDIPPTTVAELTARIDRLLPATAGGVRAAGDPASAVRRLAVCGGAGDDLIGAAHAAGADAYLTSDLRHHVTSEAPAGLALLDAAHWASEWPWLSSAAQALTRVVGVEAVVSTLCTDPWTTASRSPRT